MSIHLHRTKSFALVLVLACAMAFGLTGMTNAYADDGRASTLSEQSISGVQAETEQAATVIDLYPANEELMWPIVKASIEDNAEGQDYLVVYANGTSYDWFFSGTQAQAFAATDREADSRWVKFESKVITSEYVNSKGAVVAVADAEKYGYKLPIVIPEGSQRFTVPIVAVANASGDYTTRRADVDLAAKTVLFGNFFETIDVAVSSSVADVAVDASGSYYYKGYLRKSEGNPDTTSNEWTSAFTFRQTDKIYDKAYVVPTLGEDAEAEIVSATDEGAFTLNFVNIYKGVRQIEDGATAKVMMHVADNVNMVGSGTWIERTFTMSIADATVTISGEPLVKTVPVDKPVATTGLVYTGSELTGVPAGEGYTLEHATATNAGKYTATATLTDGYVWSDGTADAIALDWAISKAVNIITPAKTSASKTFSVKALKASNKYIALPKVKTTSGKPTWSVSTKDKKGVLSLRSNKVVVKKGAAKGVYTIKLKAKVASSRNYKAGVSKPVTVRAYVN